MKAILDVGHTHLTHIQAKAIGPLMTGRCQSHIPSSCLLLTRPGPDPLVSSPPL